MRVYKKNTVFEESLNRIRYLFDEFDDVVVSYSGGKDSTVVFNLALKVAEEKGRLPLKVFWLDQEAEWQAVVDHMRDMMNNPKVEPLWYQIPFKIFNATSSLERWVIAWEEGKEWIRPKEPKSYTENDYGTDRFFDLFGAIAKKDFKKKTCFIGGVRAEESPGRNASLTQSSTYKFITWGKRLNIELDQYTFYPIYDWSYSDIWKAIHDNKWSYAKVYDYQYIYGVNVQDMRVSNLHHETALKNLFYLQEVEPKTWEALTKRMSGLDTAAKLNKDYFIKELPFMFASWEEYRDYLTDKLIVDEKVKKRFMTTWKNNDKTYDRMAHRDILNKLEINSILANDEDLTKMKNFKGLPEVADYRKWSSNSKKELTWQGKKSKFIPDEENN